MFFSGLLLTSLTAISGVSALSVGNSTFGRACGTTPSVAEVAAMEAHFATHKVVATKTTGAKLASPINVYYHVIQSSTALAGGNVP